LAGRTFGFKSGWFPVAYCLASLVLTIVATPFIEELRSGTLIEAILLTIVLLSAVFAVGGRGKKLALALLLAAPALFARWVSYSRADDLVSTEVFAEHHRLRGHCSCFKTSPDAGHSGSGDWYVLRDSANCAAGLTLLVESSQK